MSVKDLPDYEARKWLAQNILGLDEPPELDPKALEKLSGMLSGLFEGEIDAVQLIKEVREPRYLRKPRTPPWSQPN